MGILPSFAKTGCERREREKVKVKTEFTIGLYGPAEVGKSSIMKRMGNDTFDVNYIKTNSRESQMIKREIKGKEYSFTIYDTPGEEIYNRLVKLFLKHVEYFILVFSINNKKSFIELKERFTNDIQFYQSESDQKTFILIGNKTDQSDSTEVREDEAKEFAKEINATYMTMSCLRNEGIEKIMEFIINDIIIKEGHEKIEKNLILKTEFKVG